MSSGSVQPASVPAKSDRASLDRRRQQKGNGIVTNACHVIDIDLIKIMYHGNIPSHVKDELAPLLSDVVNVPIKTRAQNFDWKDPTSDIVLDKEIKEALVSGSPLSNPAFVRAKHKISILKGLGLDRGVKEETLKEIISQLAALTDSKGSRAEDKYFVVYKNGESYNLWKDQPASATGRKKDGTLDMRTSIGKEKAQVLKTFAQDTGLTQNKTADTRTELGKKHGIPKTEMRAAETGLRNDGVTPDLRTKLGKEIAKAQEQKSREAEQRAKQKQDEQRRAAQRREEEALRERQRIEKTLRAERAARQQQQMIQAITLQQLCVPNMVRNYSALSPFGHGHGTGFAISSGFSGSHIGFHASSGSANGRELFMGPRGGIYHISSGGNRVYH